MNTIINPIDGNYDIDDGVYFLFDEEPTQAVTTFHKWIYDAVNGYTNTPPSDKNTCIRVFFQAGHHIDLPIYYKVGDNSPMLGHKSKGWVSSDPKEFMDWFKSKTDQSGQLRRIIRYFKAWKDNKKGELPSGLILTILVVNHIKYNSRDDIALRDTLVEIKNSLDSNFCCYRPTTPTDEDLFKDFSQTRKDYFLDRLSSFVQSANEAIVSDDHQKASKKWESHLGNRFPVSLAEDKSDDLLSAAHQPVKLEFPDRPITPRKPRGFA